MPRGRPLTPRFLVIVEYAAGVCVTTAVAESAEGTVEAFMVQGPACEKGEIGLRLPHRLNVLYEWYLALIGLEVQRRRAVQTSIELSD